MCNCAALGSLNILNSPARVGDCATPLENVVSYSYSLPEITNDPKKRPSDLNLRGHLAVLVPDAGGHVLLLLQLSQVLLGGRHCDVV